MLNKEFGGYLPLELPEIKGEYYSSDRNFNVLSLNCGRATFYYAAKHSKAKKIYLPYFTCKETASPFHKLGLEVKYYQLDDSL